MNEDPTRSCLNCPSYLNKDQVTEEFGKSIGAPMCKRFGKVLGAPDMHPVAQKTMQNHIAESCDKFGAPAPLAPQEHLETHVMLPDHLAIVDGAKDPSTDEDKAMVSSCLSCKFYVGDRDVMENQGWAAGLCSATGRLIIPGRASKEAKKCDIRKPGSHAMAVEVNELTAFADMGVIPMYAEAKSYDPSPLGQWKKAKARGLIPEPSTYPTEAPVSAADKEQGIRAWRRIVDPTGYAEDIFMPVFDPEFFEPHDRRFIPKTGSDEHPEDYIDAKNYVYTMMVEWFRMDETPILWGPSGSGKTELARHMAWMMQLPFDRISFTAEMEVEDLLGKMVFIDGETRFQWGRLPLAWSKPRVLLFDEPNAGPDAVWQRVRPLTDNSKQLVLDEANAEVVDRNENCFLVMAGNPAWDVRNVGVNQLADADVNRPTHVLVDLPPREVEYEILKAACEIDGWTPSKKQINGVLDNSREIRLLVEEGSLDASWSVRSDKKVIRHLRWFDPITCYRRALVDYLEPEAGKMILDIVTSGGRL